jgi:hypothetical protein
MPSKAKDVQKNTSPSGPYQRVEILDECQGLRRGVNMGKIEPKIMLSKLKKIDETSVKVLKELWRMNGNVPMRVSYTEIADKLSITRNAVKYSIERMARDGLLIIKDEKLAVNKEVITTV